MANEIASLKQSFEKSLYQRVVANYSRQTSLHEAISYALLGEGKRVRPLLTLLTTEAFGTNHERALNAALSVEYVHTYSLIHDDLPCLDNDSLRRGRATVHVAFDEATALLAGDSLLTDAFGLLAIDPHRGQRLTQWLSLAAGGQGMVLGQALDLYWTKRSGWQKQDLDEIHLLKTGALLGAAAAMGAICADQSEETVASLFEFGKWLGLSFQIQDDLLDDQGGTGKSQGKDREQGKLTYLRLMGRDDCGRRATELTERAFRSLEGLRLKKDPLLSFATQLLSRKS